MAKRFVFTNMIIVNVYVHKNTGGQIYGPQAEYEIQSNEIQSNESAFN